MPSVHQIKNTGQPINNKVQKPWSYKLLKYLLLVVVAVAAFRYFFAPNIKDIPQGVYDQTAKVTRTSFRTAPFLRMLASLRLIYMDRDTCPIATSITILIYSTR